MINTDDFIKRLEKILDYYNLSASAFADRISVQRSSLSHLLSGRNKPSLDFIIKVIEVFPEVDLYWILNGIGTFPKSENSSKPIKDEKNSSVDAPFIQTKLESGDLFSVEVDKKIENEMQTQNINQYISNVKNNDCSIEYIVIFYKDGTFKKYNSE